MERYPGPVDLVYTWVDGSDSDYRALYHHHARTPADLNPERYRDVYDLLKYSLRSVARHAPWIRHVYVVTMRPQCPAWLDTTRPGITLVHHDQIIDPAWLPTFNYNAIESHLHRIPGLSDRFLYMNDDHLLGADLRPESRIPVYGTLIGENLRYQIYENRRILISMGFLEHTPWFIDKAGWAAMQEEEPELVHRTRASRFRRDDNLTMHRLYRRWCLNRMRSRCRVVPFWELVRYSTFHKITNHAGRQRRQLAAIEAKRPRYICLNDDQREHPNPEVVTLVKAFLDRMWPDPGPFERTP